MLNSKILNDLASAMQTATEGLVISQEGLPRFVVIDYQTYTRLKNLEKSARVPWRILVTGGAGFIGSNFIQYWLKKYPDDLIVNFDKLTYAGNLENLRSVENHPNYIFVKGDICDADAVNDTLSSLKIDTIIHFAAESHVDRSILGAVDFIRTNVFGTQVLLESSLKNNIKRFHHVSTDEVYGQIPLDSTAKFNEHTKYNPRSPYSASKAASDHLVNAYHSTYGLPITITNCSNNYGPYMFPEKFFPVAITNLLEGKKIPVYTPGNQVRDWLYVEDHCRAIDLVLQKGRVGQTYCVGGMTEIISNLQCAKMIVQAMGKNEAHIEFVKDRPGHDVKYDLDWSKIRDELDFHPITSFEQGLLKTIKWYKENQEWWKPLRDKSQEYYQMQYGKL